MTHPYTTAFQASQWRCLFTKKKSGNNFQAVFLLDFVRLTTRTMHPHGRTCGEPDGIELTAIGVELNGSGRVHHEAGPSSTQNEEVPIPGEAR